MKKIIALLTALLMVTALIPGGIVSAEPAGRSFTEPRSTAIHEVFIENAELPPVAGWEANEHLNVTVPEGAPYSLDMDTACWWDNSPDYDFVFSGVFVEGTPYSIGLTVNAAEGYYFDPDCVFYINGETSLVDMDYTFVNDEDTSEAYIWSVPVEAVGEPADDPYAIHEVIVNGWGEPVPGMAGIDNMFLETPEGAPYFIIYGGWRDETDQQQMWGEEHVFIEGHEYSEGAQIWADEGYYFADDCVFTTQDESVELDLEWCYVDEYENYICYMNTVPVTCGGDPYAIHEVRVVGWGEPVEGMAGIDNVYLETPMDAPYFIIYGGWRDETDQQQMWGEEHIFIAGHEYSEGCQIWAFDGYYFAEDCVFLADEGVELDYEWCYVDEYENYICYMNTVPVVCAGGAEEHLWGDANGDGEVDSEDVVLIMRFSMGLMELDAENIDPWCDVNGDGELNMNDALIVARYVNDMIDALPVF